jgi:hypothetical protein
MYRNFNSESSNPRDRRAFAHAKISQFKQGEATYGEAFEAAHKASHARKGEQSSFGRALGNVVVDAYAQDFDSDTVVVSGLSVPKQAEIAANEASSYSPDAYMVRPDAQNAPRLKGVIHDPLAEGFAPLQQK